MQFTYFSEEVLKARVTFDERREWLMRFAALSVGAGELPGIVPGVTEILAIRSETKS